VVNAIGTILNKSNEFSQCGFYHFDIGTQRNTKLKEIVLMIKNLSGSQSKINFGAIEYRKNEIFKRKNNIDPILKLGWKPRYSIQEGLKNTINWYKENQKVLM
jgi:UDP-glucose 4-epimerase